MRALLAPFVLLAAGFAGCLNESTPLQSPAAGAVVAGPAVSGEQFLVQVLDGTSEVPVNEANVQLRYVGLNGADLNAVTDAKGLASFIKVPGGTYPLVVRAPWYKILQDNITAGDDQSAPYTVKLQRIPERKDDQVRGVSLLGYALTVPDPVLITFTFDVWKHTGTFEITVKPAMTMTPQVQPGKIRILDPSGKEVATSDAGPGFASYAWSSPGMPVPGAWSVFVQVQACAPRCDYETMFKAAPHWGM